jgi:hypothetical protein
LGWIEGNGTITAKDRSALKALQLALEEGGSEFVDSVGVHLGRTSDGKMSECKFHVGNAVEYRPPNGIWAPKGTYIVTAELPVVAGEFHYQIKTESEPHQRIARESELNGQ